MKLITDEEYASLDPAAQEILKWMQTTDHPLPGQFIFSSPKSGIFWLPPENPRIPVTTLGYNKLKGASRTGYLTCVTPSVIILEIHHRDPNAIPKVYHEPYDTTYGERMTDNGDWGMAIDEKALPKILALAKLREPRLNFPPKE